MELDKFRIKHSKIIEQYQLIEYHLEGIFGLLEEGDFEELTHRVENDAMGELIRKVRFLDKETNCVYLEKEDFSILDNIRDDRNYWSHESYLELMQNFDKIDRMYQRLTDNLKTVENMNDKLTNAFRKISKDKYK